MWPFDEHAARLPPPRTEEPANLRRNIVDELADHLTCALKREQCADAPQENQAPQHRVLDRFGDPVAVARKLWFDALWEKIMTQRILIAACVAMAVVACVALALGWQSMRHQQDMIASWQETSASHLREQKEHFERLLAQSAKSQPPSDWNPVEFRFVSGAPDGPPVSGVDVTFTIHAHERGIPSIFSTSNEQGIVSFPRTPYGNYSISARTPTGERLYDTFTLVPGESLTRTIVCPAPPAVPKNVNIRIDWPADLADKPLSFRFGTNNVDWPVAGMRWFPGDELIPRGRSYMLIAPNGAVQTSGDWPSVDEPDRWIRVTDPNANVAEESRLQQVRRKLHHAMLAEPWENWPDGMKWPGDGYVIERLEVLIPTGLRDLNPTIGGRKLFVVIQLNSADWRYRIEPGTDGAPGTLWFTPTTAAIETVRKSLAKLDEALAESAEPNAKKKKKAPTNETTVME